MDQPSTRPLPHPPPSARRSPAYTTNGNAHASSSSSTPRPGNMSPISTDPLIPPDNVIYPHGSILNPGRSLASSKELPLPRIRFPARLRELGYGGEDGLYDWDGWMDGWRVYRPLKLPKEWKVGVWGTSPFKILAASQVFMVMDVDNRECFVKHSFAFRWLSHITTFTQEPQSISCHHPANHVRSPPWESSKASLGKVTIQLLY